LAAFIGSVGGSWSRSDVAGFGTDPLLNEVAAYAIGTTVSALSLMRPATPLEGHVARHVRALEARLCGEIAHVAAA
jgi:hypothetical protein